MAGCAIGARAYAHLYVLAQRGIQDRSSADQFLQAPLTGVHDPDLLPNIIEVAQAILTELDNEEGRTLWIHGDYDADGITGSTILARMLRQLRPEASVEIHVPDRMTEGYGISVAKLEAIAAAGRRLRKKPFGKPRGAGVL